MIKQDGRIDFSERPKKLICRVVLYISVSGLFKVGQHRTVPVTIFWTGRVLPLMPGQTGKCQLLKV